MDDQQKVFVEITTKPFHADHESYITFRKELKSASFAVPPTILGIFVEGHHYEFKVKDISSKWSEKDQSLPVIVKLEKREYSTGFVESLKKDPDWVEVEKDT